MHNIGITKWIRVELAHGPSELYARVKVTGGAVGKVDTDCSPSTLGNQHLTVTYPHPDHEFEKDVVFYKTELHHFWPGLHNLTVSVYVSDVADESVKTETFTIPSSPDEVQH